MDEKEAEKAEKKKCEEEPDEGKDDQKNENSSPSNDYDPNSNGLTADEIKTIKAQKKFLKKKQSEA